MKRLVITFFLAMIPSIVTMLLLIEYFPYTGLGRVVSIPITLFFNITILLISLLITQKYKINCIQKFDLDCSHTTKCVGSDFFASTRILT